MILNFFLLERVVKFKFKCFDDVVLPFVLDRVYYLRLTVFLSLVFYDAFS